MAVAVEKPVACETNLTTVSGPSRSPEWVGLRVEDKVHLFNAPSERALEILCDRCPEYRVFGGAVVHATPEGVASHASVTTADRLGYVHNPELNREAAAQRALLQLITGDHTSYEQFSLGQSAETRITKETFGKLSDFVRGILDTQIRCDAASYLITVSNAAKMGAGAWDTLATFSTDPAVKASLDEVWRTWKETTEDNDLALAALIVENGAILPTLAKFAPETVVTIVESLRSGCNFGQLLRLESCAASIEQFQTLDKAARDMLLVHAIADICAARAHIDPIGSSVVNEEKAHDILRTIAALDHPPAEAYQQLLDYHAKKRGMTVETATGVALTRLSTWLGHTKPLQVATLRGALTALPDGGGSLVAELNCSGLGSKRAIIAYFGPALLINLAAGREPGSPEQSTAIRCGLERLRDVFLRVREEMPTKPRSPLSVICRELAEAAKDEERFSKVSVEVEYLRRDARTRVYANPRAVRHRVSDPIRNTVSDLLREPASLGPSRVSTAHPAHDILHHHLLDVGASAAQFITGRVGLITQALGPFNVQDRTELVVGCRERAADLSFAIADASHCIGQVAAYVPRDMWSSVAQPNRSTSLGRHGGSVKGADDDVTRYLSRCYDHIDVLDQKLAELSNVEGIDPTLRPRAKRVFAATSESLVSLRAVLDQLRPLADECSEALQHASEHRLPIARLRVHPEVSPVLLDEMVELAHLNRYRGGDPRIRDNGILMRSHGVERMSDLIKKGMQVVTVRTAHGDLAVAGLFVGPDLAAKFIEQVDRYGRYKQVGYIHLFYVSPKNPFLLPAYQLVVHGVAVNMPDAEVAFGRVQNDNEISFRADFGVGFQPYVADAIEVTSDIPRDPLALFPGDDSMRAYGVVIPLSRRWRESFARTSLTPAEAKSVARAMSDRRLPGMLRDSSHEEGDPSAVRADRDRYLDLHTRLRSVLSVPEADLMSSIEGFKEPGVGEGITGFTRGARAIVPSWRQDSLELALRLLRPGDPASAIAVRQIVNSVLLSPAKITRERKL